MNQVEAGAARKRAKSAKNLKRGTLDDALAQLWQRPGFLMRRCLQHTSGVFEQSCAELGLTARQYDYLFVLDIMGELGQSEIADALGLDRSTNTLVLKILERKKWIVREVVETDTRRRLVRVTSEGRRVFGRARFAADRAISSIAESVSDKEYRSLIGILQRVAHANRSDPANLNAAISGKPVLSAGPSNRASRGKDQVGPR